MSTTRRSGRARKQVDYSLDKESPDNSDDDFQESPSGPPPNKKPKTSLKTKTKPKQEEKKTKEKPTSTRKERLSLEEKMYQRELEAAIEASKKCSQSSEESKDMIQLSDDEQPRNKKTKSNMKESDLSTNKENENNYSPKGMSHEEVAASISKEQVEEVDSKTPTSTEQEEDKSVSGEDDDDYDNDDDFNEGNDEDSCDDDSDFDEEKEMKRKKRKKGQAQPSPSKVGIKPRASVTVTPIKMLKNQAKKKNTGSSKGSSIKSVSSADSGSASNSPQISISRPNVLTTSTNFLTSSSVRKSLGTGLGSVRIQSSTMLRLGLSRNVRVKPLLSKISVHQ